MPVFLGDSLGLVIDSICDVYKLMLCDDGSTCSYTAGQLTFISHLGEAAIQQLVAERLARAASAAPRAEQRDDKPAGDLREAINVRET